MKFGIVFGNAGPFADPDLATTLAQTAEAEGFESIWTVEHVVVPEGYQSPYPYSRTGKMPGGEDIPIPDPLVWLSFVAARTQSLNLGTGVVILPQRNPVVFAKQCASLDVLSGGRLILGVGIGWLREEFEAIGIPFEERVSRTEESIEAMRTLWREASPTFAGRHIAFAGAKSFPKPARAAGIPIVVGGHSDGAARRAGRLGDGFFPAKADPTELAHFLRVMSEAATGAGRDPAAIEITAGGARDLDGVKRYQDLGVHRLVIPPPGFDAESLKRGLGEFAEHVARKV